MTTTKPDAIRELVREFVGAYVDKPEALRVEFQPAESGHVYWMMKGDLDDEGKLIGGEGCHVKALELLLAEIGKVAGKVYTLRLLTNGGARKKEAPRDVIEYDPAAAQMLLARLLGALGIDASVAVGPGTDPRRSLTFVFTLKAATAFDYSKMIAPCEPSEATIVGALGTLFRAIAKKDGVRFSIAAQQ